MVAVPAETPTIAPVEALMVATAVLEEVQAPPKTEEEKALSGLKEKGMQVYVVPENEIAAWQKATESVHALFIKRTGDVGKQMVDFCKNLK